MSTDDTTTFPTGPTVEAVNLMVAEQFPGTRNRCLDLGDDFAVGAIDVHPDDVRPGGYISGPTQFGLADCTIWFACFIALGRIEPMAVTSEMSIRFLRPAIGDALRCRAVIEAVNRRSVVATAHVWCDGDPDRVTATAQATYAIPLPR